MAGKPLDKDEAELLSKIQESPRFLIEEILGETLDPQQIEPCEALPHVRRMAIKSGHSSGKDWLTARLALWFHISFFPSIVVTTGPTDRQVKQVVWGEIRSAYARSKVPIGGTMLPEAPHLKSDHPFHYMIGFTAKDANAYQGLHSENVLVILTEAQGVDGTMWPAIESLLSAPNAKLVIIGNAIYEPESEFYAAFTSKAQLYRTFTLDSRESSHCSQDYIDDIVKVHGQDSAIFRARVAGDFPTDIADTLFPLGWIEKAQHRFADTEPEYPRTLGCDVARFGSDRTVLWLGEGSRFTLLMERQGLDTMETTGHVLDAMATHNIAPKHVRIDDTGLGGGVTDRCNEILAERARERNEKPKRVTPINFGSGAVEDEKYANARAELFFNLRNRFMHGTVAFSPRDQQTLGELSIIKSKMDSKGRIIIEPKKDIKRRLGKSPDRPDGLALAAIAGDVADELETGGKPGRSMMEYYRQEALDASKSGNDKDEMKKAEAEKERLAKPDALRIRNPIGKRAMAEIPGAKAIEGGTHGPSE